MLTKFRKQFRKLIDSLAIIFIRLKISPNLITITGVIFSLLYFSLIAFFPHTSCIMILAILVYLCSVIFDCIDGAVARALKKTSRWGSFLDSFSDRISDGLIIWSLTYFNMVSQFLVFLELMGAYLVSYIRAKGESLGLRMESIGIAERAERLILILIILIFVKVMPLISTLTFYILLIATYITVAQRVVYVKQKLVKGVGR